MTNEFVPYEQALALKELGFDEPCLAWATLECHNRIHIFNRYKTHRETDLPTKPFGVPTYSQAFRWFREKYGLYHRIEVLKEDNGDIVFDFVISEHSDDTEEYCNEGYLTYEEAELACLKKLIEISSPTA